ncbi:MAG: AI-2E family transporter [Candidatus Kaiserbacteria bacterium]|nr:AI-2E family transporter [Candidatus Kaiserbacteria bacterium]
MNERGLAEYFLLALLLLAGALVFFILQPFLAPIALAAVFAVVLQPIYRRALFELKGSETLAALLVVLVCLILLIVPLAFFGARLLAESQQLYQSISSGEWRTVLDAGLSNTAPWMNHYAPGASGSFSQFSASIDDYAKSGLSWLIQHLGVAFSGVSAFFLALFIFFVTLYYLLRDGARLCRYLVRLSPLKDKDDEMILARLEVSVNSVVRGKLLIALIQGIFAGVGYAIFGVPNSILLGLISIVAALIPPFGTGLITVPAAAYLFLAGHPDAALGLFLWALIAGVIDNMIGPRLMSSGTQQHPLLMLVSVLGGIAFFGPVGVFLGPLSVSLFLTLLDLHMEVNRPRA